MKVKITFPFRIGSIESSRKTIKDFAKIATFPFRIGSIESEYRTPNGNGYPAFPFRIGSIESFLCFGLFVDIVSIPYRFD